MTAGALPFVGKSIVAGATTVGVGAFAVGTALGTSVAAAGLAVYDQVVNPNGVIYGTNGEILDYTKSAKAGIWLQNTGNSIKTFATGIVNGVTDRFEMTGTPPAPSVTPAPVVTTPPTPTHDLSPSKPQPTQPKPPPAAPMPRPISRCTCRRS